MDWLLDTNIPSELIRPQPNAALQLWFDGQRHLSMYVSVITLGELQKGISLAADPIQQSRLSKWYREEVLVGFAGRILPVDEAVADLWGRLLARSKMSGRHLGLSDGLIAATAMVHDLTLVTRNVKDFAQTGVRLFDPWG